MVKFIFVTGVTLVMTGLVAWIFGPHTLGGGIMLAVIVVFYGIAIITMPRQAEQVSDDEPGNTQ
jgi:hypothetical protein